MVQFQDVITASRRVHTQAKSGTRHEFTEDAGYCLDAPAWIPAGGTRRYDLGPGSVILPFMASSPALRDD